MASVLQSLNGALHRMMAADERVLILGEDLLDPYGGAFKVTKGLSTAYPDRVFTTPIAEAGFVGVAAGLSMRGMRPVVEIMFGDFLMLASDQLLNHITKYRWMYNRKVQVPVVIRAPMGARRGYGPTHSQSIEKHFLGMPGLVVVAPHPYLDPGALLEHVTLHEDRPVLFVENKIMYAKPLRLAKDGRLGDLHVRTTEGPYPWWMASYDDFREADVTIVAYGGMAELALEAAERLMMDEELYAEVLLPTALNPLDIAPLLESLKRSGKLVVCEEGTKTAGVGAEIVARVAETVVLSSPPRRVASLDAPIANTSSLEHHVLPQVEDIVSAAKE